MIGKIIGIDVNLYRLANVELGGVLKHFEFEAPEDDLVGARASTAR